MRGRRLLLVSPVFHGYWRSIQSAFESLGYDVTTHLYDAGSKAEKLWNKVRHELPARVHGEQRHLSDSLVTTRAIAALREARPDVVLVVRGDALTDDFWTEVRAQGAFPAMWLYDEIRRTHYDITTIAERASVASYSGGDVAVLQSMGVDAVHVPLAFDPSLEVKSRPPMGELSFIGARFPRRERLLGALAAAGIPLRAFGRDWSGHPVDRIRTWRLAAPTVPSARDLGLLDAYSVMEASIATLNIHGDQDGFTMRTFEACGVGAVQLVDRPDVAEFYDPGSEVLVFDGPESLVEEARRLMGSGRDWGKMREAAERRTLADHTFVHRARSLEPLWL